MHWFSKRAHVSITSSRLNGVWNLTLKPTAADLENGTVVIPKENVVPIAGRG
jgi:hypothetical protein